MSQKDETNEKLKQLVHDYQTPPAFPIPPGTGVATAGIPPNRTPPQPYPRMARIQPDIRGHKRSQRENGEVDQSPANSGFPKGFEGS